MRVLCKILALVALAVSSAVATAQSTYPERTIRIVVPFPPGGDIDPIARALAAHFQATWGQSAIVENKPGSAAIIGTDYVAKSAPDGHTLLLSGVGPLVIHPSLYPKLPYSVERDLQPISLIADTPMVMVINQTVPAKNLDEFLAFAKSKAGGVSYASAGTGSIPHLTAVLFAAAAGIQMTHVPYKGTAPAINDLLGGHVNMYFNPLPSARGYLKGNPDKVRPLAVTSSRRSRELPDVPTLDELGLKGFNVKSWYGLIAPAGTPKETVQKLNAELKRAISDSAFSARLIALGTDPSWSTVEQFAEQIKQESVMWEKIIREHGIKVD